MEMMASADLEAHGPSIEQTDGNHEVQVPSSVAPRWSRCALALPVVGDIWPDATTSCHFLECKRVLGLRSLISRNSESICTYNDKANLLMLCAFRERSEHVEFLHALTTIFTRWRMLGTLVDRNVNARGSAILIRKSLSTSSQTLRSGSFVSGCTFFAHVGRSTLLDWASSLASSILASQKTDVFFNVESHTFSCGAPAAPRFFALCSHILWRSRSPTTQGKMSPQTGLFAHSRALTVP